MNRLFGTSKPAAPKPTLEDTSKRLEARGGNIQEKIGRLDADLLKIKKELQSSKDPSKKSLLKQRAMNILRQKKIYEQQRDATFSQQFNIDQTSFALETVKDSVETVKVLKDTKKELQKQVKKVNLNEVEALQDDLEDMMMDANDIQDILGRSYGVPMDVDEGDLEAELDALSDEVDVGAVASVGDDGVPSYMKSELDGVGSSSHEESAHSESASTSALEKSTV